MKIVPTELEGVTVIEPDVYRDERGFFVETFRADRYLQAGVEHAFVQDNQSRSVRGTIRALHAQRKHPQGKLVRALLGTVFDVVVDIRRCSPTFRRWISVELSAENFRQIYVPPGFAHGICILSEVAEIEYKCTDYYDPADELRIIWNDPAIGVAWPVASPILSPKDQAAKTLAEQFDDLPRFGEEYV
ncbi:MAG TPA: dTDP-4-dehydrorhamnose 3,5-epimerase [Candidatus Binataceae bacterium]|nr:dTDP-4-dehydrorhamnose 3,5-epimerase [Candidatus Binataceae bacterium]